VKKYRAIFKAKDGSEQRMILYAADKETATRDMERAQFRREERFNLTFDRLQQAHNNGQLTKELFASEMDKRQRDQDRYGGGGMKLIKVEEVND
jgi:hypothetical protein